MWRRLCWKSSNMLPLLGQPLLIIKHMISWPITNQSLQNFQRLVPYLPDIQWPKKIQICYRMWGHPALPIFHIFQNTWYLWPLIMDIYTIFRKWSTNYVKKIRQKKLKYVTTSWGSPSSTYYKTRYLGQLRTNIYKIFSDWSPIYLICNGRKKLKYVTPSGGSPTFPYFSKYMISLAIDNGYLHNLQEVIY